WPPASGRTRPARSRGQVPRGAPHDLRDRGKQFPRGCRVGPAHQGLLPNRDEHRRDVAVRDGYRVEPRMLGIRHTRATPPYRAPTEYTASSTHNDRCAHRDISARGMIVNSATAAVTPDTALWSTHASRDE